MADETTATPTNTDSPKTRCILDLLFPGRTQGCSKLNRQLTHTILLHRPGLLHNVTNRHVSFSELRTLPELCGSTQMELGLPNFYLPIRAPAVTDHEAKQLEAIVSSDINKLVYISSQVLVQRQT
jgi:hypothetical protein